MYLSDWQYWVALVASVTQILTTIISLCLMTSVRDHHRKIQDSLHHIQEEEPLPPFPLENDRGQVRDHHLAWATFEDDVKGNQKDVLDSYCANNIRKLKS